MTTTPNTAHSWEYEYLPYTMSGSEIRQQKSKSPTTEFSPRTTRNITS